MIKTNTAMRDGILAYLVSPSAGVLTIELYGGVQATPNSYVGMTLLSQNTGIPTMFSTVVGSSLKRLSLAGTGYVPAVSTEGLATWALCKFSTLSFQVPVTTGTEGLVMNFRDVKNTNSGVIRSLDLFLGIEP